MMPLERSAYGFKANLETLAEALTGVLRVYFDRCAICLRPYWSRIDSALCPPCRGDCASLDCWLCKSNGHNSPDCPRRVRA